MKRRQSGPLALLRQHSMALDGGRTAARACQVGGTALHVGDLKVAAVSAATSAVTGRRRTVHSDMPLTPSLLGHDHPSIGASTLYLSFALPRALVARKRALRWRLSSRMTGLGQTHRRICDQRRVNAGLPVQHATAGARSEWQAVPDQPLLALGPGRGQHAVTSVLRVSWCSRIATQLLVITCRSASRWFLSTECCFRF